MPAKPGGNATRLVTAAVINIQNHEQLQVTVQGGFNLLAIVKTPAGDCPDAIYQLHRANMPCRDPQADPMQNQTHSVQSTPTSSVQLVQHHQELFKAS
jgi:hypothetical protein